MSHVTSSVLLEPCERTAGRECNGKHRERTPRGPTYYSNRTGRGNVVSLMMADDPAATPSDASMPPREPLDQRGPRCQLHGQPMVTHMCMGRRPPDAEETSGVFQL